MLLKVLPSWIFYQYANQTVSSIKLKQLQPVNIFSYHIHLVQVICVLSYIYLRALFLSIIVNGLQLLCVRETYPIVT